MKKENKTHLQKNKTSGKTLLASTVTEVWETVEIKLSRNYQSVGVSMGMKAAVKEGESSVAVMAAIDRRIEKALQPKVKEMSAFLDTLG